MKFKVDCHTDIHVLNCYCTVELIIMIIANAIESPNSTTTRSRKIPPEFEISNLDCSDNWYAVMVHKQNSMQLDVLFATLHHIHFLPLGQNGQRVLSSPPPSVCLSVRPSVRPSVHPCERDNSSRNILITFKLHTDVHGVKILDEFNLDLSTTFVTLPIGSRPTLLVNAITPQGISQSLSNFTEVFLRSKS